MRNLTHSAILTIHGIANVDISDISAHISGTSNGVSVMIKEKSAYVYTNKAEQTNKI